MILQKFHFYERNAPHGETDGLATSALKMEVARPLNIIRAIKVEVARIVNIRSMGGASPENAVSVLVAWGAVIVETRKHKPIRFRLNSINEGKFISRISSIICTSNKPSFGEEEVGVGAITSTRWEFPGIRSKNIK